MPAKPYPTDVIVQAQAVLEAWRNIDAALKIGDLGLSAFEAEIGKAAANQAQMNKLDSQLTDLRNQRDALHANVWDMIKRARRGVQAIYGDDSSQFEMIGGTRTSERRAATRKVPAPTKTP